MTGGGASHVRTAGHNKGTCSHSTLNDTKAPFRFSAPMFSSAFTYIVLLISRRLYVLHFFYTTLHSPTPISSLLLFSCFFSSSVSIFTPPTVFSPLPLLSHHPYIILITPSLFPPFLLYTHPSLSFFTTPTLSSPLPLLSSHHSYTSLTTLTGVSHRNHPQAYRDPRTNASREIPVRAVRYRALHTEHMLCFK